MNIGFFGILQIVFITLKVTDYIDWSWFLVMSPFIVYSVIYVLVVSVLIPWLDKVDPLWRMRK